MLKIKYGDNKSAVQITNAERIILVMDSK